jgi:hypothetical protein
MSARRQIVQVAAKGAMVLGGLFVVTVVLAAIPGHRAPVVPLASMGSEQSAGAQESAQQNPPAPDQKPDQKMDHGKMAGMPGMDMDDAKANEHAAMSDMSGHHHGEHHSEHMFMTSPRKATAEDERRANEIVEQLRAGIEKYKDYHVALNEGYKIFHPEFPQPEYHFTNYKNGFMEAFSFDASRPTSLLYKKTSDGYELVGAMYTMPKRATEEQLNERVPLSVAMWHLHTNLCMPPWGQRGSADMTKFGLHGTIATEEACDAAGGHFHPVVFGWMVHVYPYEDSLDKVFAMHHHMD